LYRISNAIQNIGCTEHLQNVLQDAIDKSHSINMCFKAHVSGCSKAHTSARSTERASGHTVQT
jgi:hypothetical protein